MVVHLLEVLLQKRIRESQKQRNNQIIHTHNDVFLFQYLPIDSTGEENVELVDGGPF